MFTETIDKDVKSFERKLGYQRSNSTVSTLDMLINEINDQLLKVGREIGGKKERSATKKVVLKALKSYIVVYYKMNNEVSMVNLSEAELHIGERIGFLGPEFKALLNSFVCIYEDSGFSFSEFITAASSSSSSDNKDLEAKDITIDDKLVPYNDEKSSKEEDEEEVCMHTSF